MPESPLRYAAALIEGSPDSDRKQWALAHLACAAARHGDCADALSILTTITPLEQRFFALENIVHYCPDARVLVKDLRAMLPQLHPGSWVAREEPDALFHVCLNSGLFSDALEICDSYEHAYHQADALAKLAGYMGLSCSRDQAPELLQRASRLLPAIDDGEGRDEVLVEIANACAALGMDGEWRKTVDSVQRLELRIEPLATMASQSPTVLAQLVAAGCSLMSDPDAISKVSYVHEPIRVCLEIGRIEEALQLVRSMPEGAWRGKGQLEICAALIKAHELDRSREIVDEIQAPWLQARALSLLAAAYYEAGDAMTASQMLRASVDRFHNADLPRECLGRQDVQWVIELGALLAKNGLNEQSDSLMQHVETNRRIAVNEKPEVFLHCARRAVPDDPSFARKALESAFRTAGDLGTYYYPRIAAQYQRMGDADAAQTVLETAVSHVGPTSRLELLWMVADAYRGAQQSFSPEMTPLLSRLISDLGTG